MGRVGRVEVFSFFGRNDAVVAKVFAFACGSGGDFEREAVGQDKAGGGKG